MCGEKVDQRSFLHKVKTMLIYIMICLPAYKTKKEEFLISIPYARFDNIRIRFKVVRA